MLHFKRPADFANKLKIYADWSRAKEDVIRNIPLGIKYHFCMRNSSVSEDFTATNDFPYNFNYEESKQLKYFHLNSRTKYTFYQLTV